MHLVAGPDALGVRATHTQGSAHFPHDLWPGLEPLVAARPGRVVRPGHPEAHDSAAHSPQPGVSSVWVGTTQSLTSPSMSEARWTWIEYKPSSLSGPSMRMLSA